MVVPRLYRAVLRLLPRAFRIDCGSEVGDLFESLWRESRGPAARARLLARGLGGLLATLVAEWWSALRCRDGSRRGDGGRSVRMAEVGNAERRVWRDVVQDVRHTLRQARRSPGFAIVVVLTMALGIGLNTVVFTGVHGLLLAPPPGVESPERLVRVYRTWPGIEYGSSSIPHYLDLARLGGAAFDGVAAWSFVTASVAAGGGSENVEGQLVSGNYFEVLGTRMALGRGFASDDDGTPVVVLSHAYWERRWGADPEILGRAIRVNGVPFQVVGVAAEGFREAMGLYAPAFWAPLWVQPTLQPNRPDRYANRNSNFLSVVARMRSEATLERTSARAAALLAGLEDEHPEVYEGSGIRVVPLGEVGVVPEHRGTAIGLSALLMAVAGVLQLIACTNVANLFLARSEHRRREIRIRLSVGAGRGRIIRQLLTEGLVLVAVAATVALVLAWGATVLIDGMPLPTGRPVDPPLEIGLAVVLFTLGTAAASGLLFGLAPALWTFRSESAGASIRPAGGDHPRVGRGLIVAQTALSMVLLLGAGIFLQNLRAASAVDVGFQADGLLNIDLKPDLLGYDRAAERALYGALSERLAARREVVAVSWADVVPLGLSGQAGRVAVGGYRAGPDEQMSIDFARVGPDYFRTMGIAVRGRGFTAADDSAAAPVAVVNEAMARRFWPGQDPVGRTVETQGAVRRVVGVAATGKYESLGEESRAFLYLPLAQDFRSGATLLVRTVGDPARVAPVARAAIRALDPSLAVEARTMRSHLGISLFPSRIMAGALLLFAIIGLLLSTLGLYGLTAHMVSRRTRDIGIRLALGADRSRVIRGVVGGGMRLMLVGLAVGVPLSLWFAQAVRGLVYTGRIIQPPLFVAVTALLALVSLLACWLPARRAAGIDPVRALRAE